jgi:sulfite reductase (NADPH) flavoprotein alpha-component
VKVKKSASQQLIAEFKLMQDNDQSHDERSEPDHSDTTSQSDFGGDLMSSKAKRVLNSYLDYKKSYKAKYVIRPDNADVAKLQVLDNTRLTPKDYDRNIFHLAMRVEGTQLATYDAGDCIGIYPENPREKVEHFITGIGFDGTELLELDSHFAGAEDGVYVMSVSQICMEYLDLFGPPSKSFYLELSKYAEDIVQKEQLAELSLDRKDAAYRARGLLAVTHASTLLEFSSLKLTAMNMLDLVPFTKPRLYSIASSRHKHPGEVHLLAVEHDWENSKGERCVGLSTYYMDKLRPNGAWHAGGDVVASLVRSPVLKLPKDSKAPVVMAGMGTGLAPFRAFIEERSVMKKKGQSIGNMRLYFGARHKKGEFLYRNELEAYEAQGWLKLRCAWSRDQKHKIYVQNLIAEDDEEIWEALKPQVNGSFYICGPIAPLEDIKKAITNIFKNHGLDGKYLDEMEATGRFATEVY